MERWITREPGYLLGREEFWERIFQKNLPTLDLTKEKEKRERNGADVADPEARGNHPNGGIVPWRKTRKTPLSRGGKVSAAARGKKVSQGLGGIGRSQYGSYGLLVQKIFPELREFFGIRGNLRAIEILGKSFHAKNALAEALLELGEKMLPMEMMGDEQRRDFTLGKSRLGRYARRKGTRG